MSMSDANMASLIAQRDAQNPNCKIFLTLGGASSTASFIHALDWNGNALVDDATYPGLAGFVDYYLDIVALHGFDGVDVDAEVLSCTGPEGLGGHGRYVYALAAELRAQMDARFSPRMPLVMGAFSRSATSNTKEFLAKKLYDDGLTDWIVLPGYGMIFPNFALGMVQPHCALDLAFDPPRDTITPVLPNDMIECMQQYTAAPPTGVSFPGNKIILGLQAGGSPWRSGAAPASMVAPPGSVGRGPRFPGDQWTANPPELNDFSEILWRNRAAFNTTGAYTVDAAGDFAYVTFHRRECGAGQSILHGQSRVRRRSNAPTGRLRGSWGCSCGRSRATTRPFRSSRPWGRRQGQVPYRIRGNPHGAVGDRGEPVGRGRRPL